MAIRPKLRVSDVLETMQVKNFTIPQSASVLDALSHLIDQSLASSLVVNNENEILGIFTARDILKCIQRHYSSSDSRTRRDTFLAETKIKELMTTRNHLVYCSPSDSARRCREIMFQCKIRNLPVIDNGEVRGIITAKNLADASFNIIDTGGKKGFIHNVTGRRGLPEGTRINQDAIGSRQNRSPQQNMLLDMEVASFALPHPFKRPEGVAMSRRLYGADELSTDMELCEDAHFALKVVDPLTLPSNAVIANPDILNAAESADNVRIKDESRKVIGWGAPEVVEVGSTEVVSPTLSTSSSHIYLCVADGVGSWRQFGVDPRAYSHRLVENARKVIESDMQHRELIRHSPFDRDLDAVHPLDVIMDAWNMTNSEGVVGSSTICVATLDRKLGQLSYSNIGDCGLLVIRHIDNAQVGYLAKKSFQSNSSAHTAHSDLHIAFLSQQQLKSFNLPYQLGFTNIENTPNAFESPTDADTASISVLPGDIVILATDGLFDNMEMEEIVAEVASWEENHSVTEIGVLAEQLVQKARLLSLDKHKDSPFALLAKENDIMWGGGMPDDTTVVVARVTTAA
eukprot:CAMPEP_0184970654 /NCGR_PEP_ID=MMETSP1098-20130426/3044_1 /TAXON_ID=89044 /ORGANISM="Spumella elongata, Strain CCAP 955/1" /LENGTH=570 /DNA_ID=CAMNT_0027492613 /DNA_START=288 /DNA_END=2000 /DNA_ORIENTATION=+